MGLNASSMRPIGRRVAADTAVAGVPRSRPARARAATCVHPRAVLTFEHVEGRFHSGHGKAVSE